MALIFSIFLWPLEPLLQYPFLRAQQVFGTDWSLFRTYRGAFLGLIATDDSAPHSRREAAKIPPERAFLGPIGAFWGKPPFGVP